MALRLCNPPPGKRSLIDHIKQFCEYYYENNPLKLPEEERAGYKRNLDILVPFLLEHSQLTDEEQRILDDFKQAHPISRTPCTAAYAALMNGANIIPLEYRVPNSETKIDGYHPIADVSSPKLSDLKLVRTDEGKFNITGTSNGFSGRHENCILNTFENIDSAFEYITTNERTTALTAALFPTGFMPMTSAMITMGSQTRSETPLTSITLERSLPDTLYREQRKVLFSVKMTPISAAIQ